MKYQKLGKTDLNASVVAFGAWGIGGGIVWPDMSLGVKDVERLLDAATELGINYIDTAPVYGTGVSEDLLGKALRVMDKCREITARIIKGDKVPPGKVPPSDQVLPQLAGGRRQLPL